MLKKETDWFPINREDQFAMFQNIKAKIGGYKQILNLTNGQVELIEVICNTFIATNEFVEQTQITTQNIKDWQNLILNGSPKGAIPPPSPSFQRLIMPQGAFIGIFEEFKNLVETIKSAKYYTESIGADLMIIQKENKESEESKFFPSLKLQSLLGGRIYLEGDFKGMPAMRIEYRNQFSDNWRTVAFLTKLPAEFGLTIRKEDPRTGQLRAIFMKDNVDVGQFSLNYPVSIS